MKRLAWVPFVLLGLTTCSGDGPVIVPRAEPGALNVTLSGGIVSALLLNVSGPVVDSITAPGASVFSSASDDRRVVLVGALNPGVVLEVWVPDVAAVNQYGAAIEEVADTQFRTANPSSYALTVAR